MRKFLLLLLLITSTLAAQDVSKVQEAIKERRYADAAKLASQIESKHPDYDKLDLTRYWGAVAYNQFAEYLQAEQFLKRLRENSPESEKAEAGLHLLAEVLYKQRKLDEAIQYWQLNLKTYENSRLVQRWRYGIAESNFRCWRFKEAEKLFAGFTEEFPESKYLPRVRMYQADINPELELKGLFIQGYTGKFVDDIRFKARVKELPGMLANAQKQIENRLGIKAGKLHSIVFKFKDVGFRRATNRATASTICYQYKPLHVVTFYTEFMVVSKEDYYSRIIHELKHAIFRNLMGNRYLNLPRWVREGLAVVSADQLTDRTKQVLSNSVFGGKDPLNELDGLDERSRGPADYIEDGTAFVYLTKLKGKKAISKFCEAIISEGKTPAEAIENLTGKSFEEFKVSLAKFMLKHMKKVLGKGYEEYQKIISLDPRSKTWAVRAPAAKEKVIPALTKWLKAYPDHALSSNVHYLFGKYSVWLGDYGTGRKHLQKVIDDYQLTSSICDDAFGWICKSYGSSWGNKPEAAEKAWGEYLRDYSWSTTAIKNKNNHEAAGPVTADD
ncbi:MAG: hypothetical protein L3J82_07135 [Planctomycetes bacterium]|nr:hypothetical protein [Planctomycetota bacterium]